MTCGRVHQWRREAALVKTFEHQATILLSVRSRAVTVQQRERVKRAKISENRKERQEQTKKVKKRKKGK